MPKRSATFDCPASWNRYLYSEGEIVGHVNADVIRTEEQRNAIVMATPVSCHLGTCEFNEGLIMGSEDQLPNSIKITHRGRVSYGIKI